MKIELTDDEVTTIMVALDNYRHERETDSLHTGDPQDQEDAGSAEWIWQKLFHAQELITVLVRSIYALTQTSHPKQQRNFGTIAATFSRQR